MKEKAADRCGRVIVEGIVCTLDRDHLDRGHPVCVAVDHPDSKTFLRYERDEWGVLVTEGPVISQHTPERANRSTTRRRRPSTRKPVTTERLIG